MQVPKIITAIQNRILSWSGFTLAWLSFLAGLVGGFAAINTLPGSVIRGVAGSLPYRAGIVVAVLLTIAGLCDLFLGKGFIPNRIAVAAACLAPSLWQLAGGRGGATAHAWTAHVNGWSQSNALRLLGDGSLGFVALLCLAGAVLLANRAAPKLQAGSGQSGAMAGQR